MGMKTWGSLMYAALVALPVLAAEPECMSLQMEVGQTRRVLLDGNATTGYMWKLAKELPAESPVCVSLGGMERDDTMCCGAPTPVTLTMTGMKPGKAVVHLVYARPWEKGKAPAREAVFTVTVQAPAK